MDDATIFSSEPKTHRGREMKGTRSKTQKIECSNTLDA